MVDQALDILLAVVADAGGTPASIGKLTIYVIDRAEHTSARTIENMSGVSWLTDEGRIGMIGDLRRRNGPSVDAEESGGAVKWHIR